MYDIYIYIYVYIFIVIYIYIYSLSYIYIYTLTTYKIYTCCIYINIILHILNIPLYIYTHHTIYHTYIYIYIYVICIHIYICVCVQATHSCSFEMFWNHRWLCGISLIALFWFDDRSHRTDKRDPRLQWSSRHSECSAPAIPPRQKWRSLSRTRTAWTWENGEKMAIENGDWKWRF